MKKEDFLSLKGIEPGKYLSALLLFLMGNACVVYLGESFTWSVFLQGLCIIFFFLVGNDLLQIYYFNGIELGSIDPIGDSQRRKGFKEEYPKKLKIFQMAFVFLSTSGLMTFYLIIRTGPLLTILIPFCSLFSLVILDRLTLNKKIDRCTVEIIETVITGVMIPLFAFTIQTNFVHKIILFFAFPVLLFLLTGKIIQGLKNYTVDLKKECLSIVQKIGWLHAINLHNGLILLSFSSFFSLFLAGIPWSILWPMLLCIPIGALEIWLLEGIKEGNKPLWNMLGLISNALMWLPIYLITLSLWIG